MPSVTIHPNWHYDKYPPGWYCSLSNLFLFLFIFLCSIFFPWGLQGNSVAMARFGEVTGHEMGWLGIVRPYLRGILSKTKKCKALKEAIAYPISPPVFQRQNNLCSQIITVMLTCRFNNLIHDVYMPSLENIFGLCKNVFFLFSLSHIFIIVH